MGLRAGKVGDPRRSASFRLCLGCVLLLFCCSGSFSQANRLPKFPSASKSVKDLKDKLKPVTLRSVQSATPSEKHTTTIASEQTTASEQKKEGTESKSDSGKHKSETAKNSSTESAVTSFTELVGDNAQGGEDLDESQQDSWKTGGKSLRSEESNEDSPVLLKSRLKPNDVLKKGGKKKDPHAKLMSGGKHSQTYNYTEHRVQRSGILDIVLTHYDIGRTEEMINYWLNFLQMEKVQALKPYVFIYCQNEKYDLDEEDFRPILQLGGEIQHLPNIGRESHAYLQHITTHYQNLANHTLFAQDQSDINLPDRFEMLFEQKTGFLPLSLVGHVDCDDPFLPKGVIPQIYAMFASELCPPVGYTSSFEGQFVVSKPRIQRNSWWTYTRLQDVLSADESHWIHQTHDNQHYKSKSNPMFGHVLERSWSVAFDCFESWREGNCWQCIVVQGMHNCGDGDCQCFDKKDE